MSCHISALCISLPYPKRGLVDFGERNSWRVEMTPISPLQSTNNTSASPSNLPWWQGDIFEESTFHIAPQFLTQKEEFSTYPSSGLRRRDTQHVKGEACDRANLFSGQHGHTVSVLHGGSDHRPDLLSALQLKPSLIMPVHFRKAAHPSS